MEWITICLFVFQGQLDEIPRSSDGNRYSGGTVMGPTPNGNKIQPIFSRSRWCNSKSSNEKSVAQSHTNATINFLKVDLIMISRSSDGNLYYRWYRNGTKAKWKQKRSRWCNFKVIQWKVSGILIGATGWAQCHMNANNNYIFSRLTQCDQCCTKFFLMLLLFQS